MKKPASAGFFMGTAAMSISAAFKSTMPKPQHPRAFARYMPETPRQYWLSGRCLVESGTTA
jgi:hypothetical protein